MAPLPAKLDEWDHASFIKRPLSSWDEAEVKELFASRSGGNKKAHNPTREFWPKYFNWPDDTKLHTVFMRVVEALCDIWEETTGEIKLKGYKSNTNSGRDARAELEERIVSGALPELHDLFVTGLANSTGPAWLINYAYSGPGKWNVDCALQRFIADAYTFATKGGKQISDKPASTSATTSATATATSSSTTSATSSASISATASTTASTAEDNDNDHPMEDADEPEDVDNTATAMTADNQRDHTSTKDATFPDETVSNSDIHDDIEAPGTDLDASTTSTHPGADTGGINLAIRHVYSDTDPATGNHYSDAVHLHLSHFPPLPTENALTITAFRVAIGLRPDLVLHYTDPQAPSTPVPIQDDATLYNLFEACASGPATERWLDQDGQQREARGMRLYTADDVGVLERYLAFLAWKEQMAPMPVEGRITGESRAIGAGPRHRATMVGGGEVGGGGEGEGRRLRRHL
ncbi:hypothetical protein C1H76_4979 [Elsinoe australis]|uniref:Uncharacterized protein n=1 Tax=Elsinoe australis TaxID=40998 RepID=A0A4U7AWN9_9PEZI|nr:hypothetical protein C1H76_4979 [Elsinoe australis]